MERIINGKRYLVVADSEFEQKKNEPLDKYTLRTMELYSKCTHWLCRKTSIEDSVTENKVYVFKQNLVIIDDENTNSMKWLTVEGDLLVKID